MAFGPWGNEETASTKFSGSWITEPSAPEATLMVLKYGGLGRQQSKDRAKTALQFVGRNFPVYDLGESRAESVNVDTVLPGEDEDTPALIETLRTIVGESQIVLFRDGRGRKMYAMPTDFVVTDAEFGGYAVSFLLNRVDFDEALPEVSEAPVVVVDNQPKNFTVTVDSPSSTVLLNWDDVAGAELYTVYLDGVPVLLAETSLGTYGPLLPGTYSMWVTATVLGVQGPPSESQGFVIEVQATPGAGTLTVSAGGDTTISPSGVFSRTGSVLTGTGVTSRSWRLVGSGATGTAGTAAFVNNWGVPHAESDEFNYSGTPDPAKWDLYDGVGHDGNGLRVPARCNVDGSKLVISGLAGSASTGGMGHVKEQQYGKWEIRARSYYTTDPTYQGTLKSNSYHPVALIWPTSESWPADGEYDFMENDGPGQAAAAAFLHYPSLNGADSQVAPSDFTVDMRQFHNYAIEWTSTFIKLWVDGVLWYSATGGSNANRKNIQEMPSGGIRLQLDAFNPSGMQACTMEVDWVRAYPLVPTGASTVLSTTDDLNWTVPSTPGSYVLEYSATNPSGTATDQVIVTVGSGGSSLSPDSIYRTTFEEMAYELTSTAENSRKDWYATSVYGYIEDIADERGYTAGIVGFCSGTGDMLELIQRYNIIAPGNPLQTYTSALTTLANEGEGPTAGSRANSLLGATFRSLWLSQATNAPLFRQAQREMRDASYWRPAFLQAVADGVGPLGLAILYDISVNHGPGSDSESFGGIVAAARAAATPPISGGNETTYLTKLIDARSAVLTSWGDNPADGRVAMHRALLATGNLLLTPTISWSVYGDPYTITTRPDLPTEAARPGNVQPDAPSGGGGGGGIVYAETYKDSTVYPTWKVGTTVVNVSTSAALVSALSAATNGQIITLANGTYSGDFVISGKTGGSNGIVIKAANPLGAVFTSGSSFTITSCTDVSVWGMDFPFDQEGDTLAIRGTSNRARFMRCRVGPTTLTDSATVGNYVYVADDVQHFRIGYCTFRNKGTSGNGIRVYGNFTSFQVCRYGRIDHNLFDTGGTEDGNDKEPIRYGVSTMSRSNAYANIERNVFKDIASEPEVISCKAANIQVRGNTLLRCAGGMVIRHGRNSTQQSNYVVDRANTTASGGLKSGGSRFYDSGHLIEDNYFDGLSSTSGFQRPIILDTGDAGGSSTDLSAHWNVIDATVQRNVIKDCNGGIYVGDNYTTPPDSSDIINNDVINSGGTAVTVVGGNTMTGASVTSGNTHYASAAAGGYTADAGGIFRKTGRGPKITYLTAADVGTTADLTELDKTGVAI